MMKKQLGRQRHFLCPTVLKQTPSKEADRASLVHGGTLVAEHKTGLVVVLCWERVCHKQTPSEEADRASLTHGDTLVSPHKTGLVVVLCWERVCHNQTPSRR